MDKLLIKEKILGDNRKFKKMAGTFYGHEIIYNYMTFILSEPYTANLLSPLIERMEKEAIASENSENNNIDFTKIDVNDPNFFDKIPIFQNIFQEWLESDKNNTEFKIMSGLPLFLLILLYISSQIEEIKDLQKANNIKGAQEIIQKIKDTSFLILPTPDNYGGKRITYSQILDVCMEMLNKYIIDEIDTDNFLNNSQPKNSVVFKDDFLYIKGEKIKIILKNDKPLDYYILEVIFSKDDLTEQTDYSEIAEFLREEYDGKKQRYSKACDNLNKKIAKQTNNQIIDFMLYTTGKTGWCKINKKYL